MYMLNRISTYKQGETLSSEQSVKMAQDTMNRLDYIIISGYMRNAYI